MKIKVENKKIYMVVKEYNAFYMKAMPCERRITLGGAIRLRKELDAAIRALHGKDEIEV